MSTTVFGQLSGHLTGHLSGRLPGQLSRRLSGVLTPEPPTRAIRRVRHEVRDGIAVIAFSAVSSTATALALLMLVRLAG